MNQFLSALNGRRLKRDFGLSDKSSASSIARDTVVETDVRPKFLVVFDFDLTLTTFHVWRQYRNAPLDQIIIEKSIFVDLEAFKSFVVEARCRNAEIAIATFGRRDVVNKALSFAFGKDHGIVISTPADHYDPRFEFAIEDDRPRCVEGTDVLGDKNTQLDYLCNFFNVSKSQCFIADDDPVNIAAAQQHGVFAQHTPQGAHKAILDALLARIPPKSPASCSRASSAAIVTDSSSNSL